MKTYQALKSKLKLRFTLPLAALAVVAVTASAVAPIAHGACFLWLCSAAPATTQSAAATPSVTGGYALHTMYQDTQAKANSYAKLAKDGGAQYIRDDINWVSTEPTKGTYDWTNGDKFITAASTNNLRPLIIIDTAPSWASGVAKDSTPHWFWAPPTNNADFASFATQVVKRYGTNGTFWQANPTLTKVVPVGIELWNEPNGSMFWGDKTPDPVKYTAMLKSGYSAVKAAESTIPVLSAGLGPVAGYNDIDCNGVKDSGSDTYTTTGINYFEQIYKNGGKGYFDAVSWHPYMYIRATANEMMAKSNCSGWSQMVDTSPSIRSFMTTYGDSAKKIWATETGAPSCIANAAYPCMSEAEQSNLAYQQITKFRTYTWRGAYFWYDLQDDYGGASLTDREQHYGTTRADNTLKPSYSTIKTQYLQ